MLEAPEPELEDFESEDDEDDFESDDFDSEDFDSEDEADAADFEDDGAPLDEELRLSLR